MCALFVSNVNFKFELLVISCDSSDVWKIAHLNGSVKYFLPR